MVVTSRLANKHPSMASSLRASNATASANARVRQCRRRHRIVEALTSNGVETVRVTVPSADGGEQDVFAALADERVVFLGQRVDEDVAIETCARLLALEAEDAEKEITMYVNCTAGTQYCVTAILDVMEYVSCPVKTVAFGCVAGPPVMLVAAGERGRRYAMPSARMILSQPLGGLKGTSIEVKIQAKELNRNAKAQVGFIARYTGQDADELEAMMARDTYMGVEDAIKFGLIDHSL